MKKIGVIPNEYKDTGLSCTLKVVDYLLKNDCIVYIPDIHKSAVSNTHTERIVYVDSAEIYSVVELIVSIGGDGTILEIAHLAAPLGLPVLGINMGTIGFMTELEVSEINLLDNIFLSDYHIEERMMIDVIHERNGKEIASYCALNDVVLFKGIISKLIEINFFCNDVLATSYRADGLIVATPTGSTAYSLSAGGAVIDPDIDALCVTPISSNAFLNSFPMVYSTHNKIVLEVARERDDQVYLSIDGMENERILFGDRIIIRKSEFTTKLVRIKNTGFYEVMYKKLSERGKS